MGRILIPASVVVLLLVGGWWYMGQKDAGGPSQGANSQNTPPSAGGGEDNIVEFACDDGKHITAVFRPETIALTLSDGRQMELDQIVNGSDISYSNTAGTIKFEGRGAGGALIEGGNITYENCIADM